jgi:hypothetical protein
MFTLTNTDEKANSFKKLSEFALRLGNGRIRVARHMVSFPARPIANIRRLGRLQRCCMAMNLAQTHEIRPLNAGICRQENEPELRILVHVKKATPSCHFCKLICKDFLAIPPQAFSQFAFLVARHFQVNRRRFHPGMAEPFLHGG